MKLPIAISALIVVVAMALGWKIDRRLASAQEDGRRLAVEAKRLSISAGVAHPDRGSKRVREDRDAEARQLAVEYNTEAKKWESVAMMDSATEERYLEIHRRIEALDSGRLKAFITDVLVDKTLLEVIRAERAVKLLPLLARKDPQSALSLFKEHYAAIKISLAAGNVIPECLGAWAKNDPLAAVEWMTKNAEEFPAAMLSQSRGNVIHCAAEKDPRVALSIIARLELNDSDAHSMIYDIVMSAKTDERMTTTLAALREYREENQADNALRDAADQNLGYFAEHFRKVGFEAASKWINDAKLSPKELDSFCERLGKGIVEDTGKWIEWMGNTLPTGTREWPIMDMMGSWTSQDYEAAGNWLASASEGPARNAAIRGYAQTVFKHDPETAMQWIMTLPPGKDRDASLHHIHLNWPKEDPAGKEAFAKEHGIK